MNLFEPRLVLTKERDGEYTLHAITLTPNACYVAGPAQASPPPQVMLLPEVLPVVLHLRHHSRRCIQLVNPVRHCLPDLALGAAHGKTALTAFVMVDDRIVGSASLDMSQLGSISKGKDKEKPMPIDTSDWVAWANAMPGPDADRSLHVQGTVTVPDPGFVAELCYAAPQGINPRELILDLVVKRCDGIWPQVVTSLHVTYREADAAGRYDGVLVREPDGDGVRIPIETAR